MLVDIALITAAIIEAVPSPKTRPEAVTIMKAAWLTGEILNQLCSIKLPITLGIVHFACTQHTVLHNNALLSRSCH